MNRKFVLLFILSCVLAGRAPINAQVSVSPKKLPATEQDDYLKRNLKTAHSLVNVGNYDRAIDLLKALEKSYGQLPQITAELKNAYYMNKDYASVRAMVLEDLRVRPEDFDLTCQLGEIYFLTDSLDQALATWQKAFQLANPGIIISSWRSIMNVTAISTKLSAPIRRPGEYSTISSCFWKSWRTSTFRSGIMPPPRRNICNE